MSRAKFRFSGVVFAALIFWNYSAAADDPCYELRDPEPRIIACTERINSGKWEGNDQANYYNNRGLAYRAKGDYDLAIADFNQAISLDPKFFAGKYNRGLVYRAKGDYDRAIADFSQVISIIPKNETIYYDRGLVYRAKGDYDRAIADFNQAISLHPKYSAAYYNRGLAYRAKGDNNRAIADFNQVISIDLKHANAYNSRGLAYYEKGDYGRAIADYTQAISIEPNDGARYRNRGLANLYNGAPTNALADVTQASALNPEDAYSALWLNIIGQRNNVPSNLSEAVKKLDMTPWPAPVIRLFLGQTTPAAVVAAADDPDVTKRKGRVCEAHFYTGELLLQKGSKDQAARLFRLAASDCPHGFDEWTAANAELKALGVAP